MRPIYLIGYMGSGKTTLGRAVALAMSMRFVDMDEYIEQRRGMSVREIFAKEGEEAFRRLERDALDEVSAMRDVIVATGGGTPCQPGLMQTMLDTGLTVWLDVPVERLHERLAIAREQRPLIASLDDPELREYITRNLGLRKPHYSRAALTFDASRLEDADQIAQSTDQFINLITSTL